MTYLSQEKASMNTGNNRHCIQPIMKQKVHFLLLVPYSVSADLRGVYSEQLQLV